MTTKPTQQEALDRAAHAAHSAVRDSAQLTVRLMGLGDMEGEELARQANQSALTARSLLINVLGATSPTGESARDRVPLHLLNTPATRELLAALEAAARAGQRVDEERGWIDETGEGIGFAETLYGMALGLRSDIEGPVGSGLE